MDMLVLQSDNAVGGGCDDGVAAVVLHAGDLEGNYHIESHATSCSRNRECGCCSWGPIHAPRLGQARHGTPSGRSAHNTLVAAPEHNNENNRKDKRTERCHMLNRRMMRGIDERKADNEHDDGRHHQHVNRNGGDLSENVDAAREQMSC